MPELDHKDLDGAGQNVVITEGRAKQEKTDGGGHERNDEALFFLIKAWSDEKPDLIEDERAGDDGACEQRNVEIQIQGIHGMREDEGLADFEQWSLKKMEELDTEDPGNGKSSDEVGSGVDNSPS